MVLILILLMQLENVWHTAYMTHLWNNVWVWHGVVVVHSAAAKTCQPRLPHQAAPPQTGSSPGPGCQSPHSSPEACHHGRPNKEPEISEACLGSPAPPTDSTGKVRWCLRSAADSFWSSSLYRFLSHHYGLGLTCLATAENFITWRVSS